MRRVEEAAQKLVAERLLLQEDAERLVERAKSAEIARRFTPAASVAASAAGVQEEQRSPHDL